jgi:hypothetical protein
VMIRDEKELQEMEPFLLPHEPVPKPNKNFNFNSR